MARCERRRVLAMAIAAGAVTVAGCGGGGAPVATGAGGGGGIQKVTVRATEFAFAPSQVTMSGPGALAITLENKGLVEHDFSIVGVPGKLVVPANSSGSLTFQVEKSGTYQIACTVAGHLDAGMKGTLVVK